jgi:GNAT superfamily N-acetyltransferase
MSATTVLRATAELGKPETDELTAMKAAVYPNSSPPAREWAPREWGVFVRIENQLVSYTGIVIRDGTVDGTPATIGGIGGVATHPAHRGKGYASLGMARALDFMLGRNVDFALLVCRDELLDYYSNLGWHRFTGRLLETQHGRPEVFTFNDVMVGDLNSPAPVKGTIDLKGPAW